MQAPAFWWQQDRALARWLAPLGVAYGAISAMRLARPGRAAGIPVVCIGNLTLGGAGKTPAALAVAKILHAAGKQPWFLSRGYGGRMAGPVLIERNRHSAEQVGDEPLLLAQLAPTVVARNRVRGARYARCRGAELIVMDDGFQNPTLRKDLAILIVDGRRGIGNGRVFPAGPLRAPLEAQLERAHAIVVVGAATGAATVIAAAQKRGLAVFPAELAPDEGALASLRGSEVLAFAGIADPAKFFITLAEAGVRVSVERSFADHHRYRAAEAGALLRQARQRGLRLVTTEKDAMRLAGEPAMAKLAAAARVLPVRMKLHGEAAFLGFVLERLSASA